MKKILVPVDGTPASLAAVRAAMREGPSAVERIDLINVQPLLHRHISRWVPKAQRDGWRAERSAAALAPARALLEGTAFNWTAKGVSGPVAPTITRTAQDLRSDEIIVGAARRGPFGRAFANSVSTQLLETSAVPVRVIPTADAPLFQRLALPAGLGIIALLLLADE